MPNPTKDAVLALFPDNNTQEISAADIRTFVNAVFDVKEDLVIKLDLASDLILEKSRIFYRTIVIVENDTKELNGIYLSKVDNPINIVQCTKITNINEYVNIFPDHTAESFINKYENYKESYEANFYYDINDDISSLEVVDSSNVIYYTVEFSYDINGNISSKKIIDSDGNYAIITFSYNLDIITNKYITMTWI